MADNLQGEELKLQLTSLEKTLRENENKYKKETALLKQKIELLKIELKDSQERELSTRRLHDTMFNAFKNDPKNSSQFGDPNIDKLIKEYDSKLKYLAERNEKLEQALN